MAQYDVITLGETMIRLTPPDLKRLEHTSVLEVELVVPNPTWPLAWRAWA